MKKKILLFCLILISVLFIGIGKVKAEEYTVWDLVVIINTSGGETMKFYIVVEEDGYILESENAIFNSSLSESEDISVIPQYLEDLEETIKKQKYSFIQGFEFWGIDALIDQEIIENIDEKGINVNIPSFMKNYDNVFITYESSNNFAIFMKQVNGSFMIKKVTANSIYELDNKIGEKLNFYLGLFVSKENSNIMRKVDLSQSVNTNEIQTTTVNDNKNTIPNPKTNDINTLLVGISILLTGFITILGIRKLKKLNSK